ncbi:MAG: hypothetical protein H0X71_08360 [Rubrobacter sp.]|nr:hypothetical protein [Rubrobacter sp.]
MMPKSKGQEAEFREVRDQDKGRLSVEKDEIGQVSEPQVAYYPREDATPEGELSALVAVYKFCLECHDRKKGVRAESGGEDGEEADESSHTGEIASEERP